MKTAAPGSRRSDLDVKQSRAIIIPSTLPAFSQTRERHIQPSRLADVTALPTAQPITALPKDLVDDGELVILLLRPSPLYIVLSSFVGLVMIALITFALAYLARLPWIGWTDRQAFLLGFGLASLRLGWQLLEWGSRLYVLTDRRIVWASSNPAVATVSDRGVVTAVQAGRADVAATAEGKTGVAAVTVLALPAQVSSVRITPDRLDLFVAQAEGLAAVAYPLARRVNDADNGGQKNQVVCAGNADRLVDLHLLELRARPLAFFLIEHRLVPYVEDGH